MGEEQESKVYFGRENSDAVQVNDNRRSGPLRLLSPTS